MKERCARAKSYQIVSYYFFLEKVNYARAQVIAGREGALPTVVSGLVDIPIIAVPTSIGYGYGGQGVSALM